MRFFILIFLIFWSFGAFAQADSWGNTSKTSFDPVHKEKKLKKEKRLLSLYKKNPRKTLIGNKCMDEVTRSMGFEYVLQPKGKPGNRTEAGRWLHNFSVKFSLFFKNGPFWKIKLNKRRKECMAKTGDYVG